MVIFANRQVKNKDKIIKKVEENMIKMANEKEEMEEEIFQKKNKMAEAMDKMKKMEKTIDNQKILIKKERSLSQN